MKKFQSRTQIKVKGLNQERAFNELSKEIKVLSLKREDSKTSEIQVAPKDAKKAKKILRNNNFEILEEKSWGPHKWAKWLLSCYGVLAGIVLASACYVAQSKLVWQIKVYGTERLSEQEITRVVNESLESRFSPNIDTKKLELALRDKFNDLSSVSVAIVGQSLVINVHEALSPEEMQTNFSSIVSSCDGIITRIELIQGTAVVKEGDIVKAGQTLVEPYIIDTDGQRREVKPIANITAEAWLEGRQTHMESFYRTYRTGKRIEQSRILLFGLPIYSNSSSVPFKEYEEEKCVNNLSKNNILPFKLEKNIFYETATELIESTFEEKREEIVALARTNALQNFQSCDIIKDEHYDVKTAGGVTEVTYILTVEREIGRSQ